ncbi:hypothetical protein CR155_20285 [Pollutimonas nitritireducens]|uniref:Uncharacterized protein n=2 Tax=Pollutimonas nitritireducens TaxID=2045209 RepID=A0A2N4UAI1_9BURK|nr:hypothetical protein CR155_20285 [Pollutimonas nitritireducens]
MISVIAYDLADYELLRQQVTVSAVEALFGSITKGSIERYEVPRNGALNFVVHEVLEGGRSRTLAFEESGKALSSLMLTLPITVPEGRRPRKRIGHSAIEPKTNESVPEQTEGKRIRLGSATAWSRDRFGPAEALVERGALDYICFESMSEVTMSAVQAAKEDGHSTLPYDPYLIDRLGPILKACKDKGIKIISNQGWMDPDAAALRLQSFAEQEGIKGLKIAAVRGGILTDEITGLGLSFLETDSKISDSSEVIVSAEAYGVCQQ